jgi:hypothetical protein
MKARMTFTPQAWVNDYAVEVDAQGPTSWSADIPEGIHDNSDEADELGRAPEAPEWIRNWHGPSEVQIEYEPRPRAYETTVLEAHVDSDESGRLEAAGFGIIASVDRAEDAAALLPEIARRWNAHAELVECLTRYVVQEETAAPYSSSPMREAARAVLAKVQA